LTIYCSQGSVTTDLRGGEFHLYAQILSEFNSEKNMKIVARLPKWSWK